MELMATSRTIASRPAKLRLICKPLPRPVTGTVDGDKAKTDLSTVAELDRRRCERGISLNRLLQAAGVEKNTWYLGKAGGNTRADTIRRLDDALATLSVNGTKARPPAAIAALVRAIEHILLNEIGRDRRLMAACDPRRRRRRLPERVPAGRLRLIAVYVATVELEIKNAELARALGVERQAVKQSRDAIEELRHDKRFDALIDRVAAAVRQ